MKTILWTIVAVALLFSYIPDGDEYVPIIKANAAATWEKAGFEIVGYQGYEYSFSPSTHGGAVWYTVRRIPDNGVTYQGCITKWRDEFHIYNLKALDAIKPN